MAQDAGSTRVCVSAVMLLLGGEARELLLYPGISVRELQRCVCAGFPALAKGLEKPAPPLPVAVRHASSHVFYPLSLLCLSPEKFEGAVYHVVMESRSERMSDGDDAAEVASASQKSKQKASHSRNRHHSRRGGKQSHPSHKLGADRSGYQLQHVTTTSDANEEDEEVEAFHEKQVVLDGENDEEAGLDDEGVQNIDLTDFELPQLVNVFTQACPTGALDRTTRRSDIVDVADFLGGVSVFACGERDEKIQLTFELYDVDGDGFISKEEMTKYLTAVFLVIGETSPELFQQNKCVPSRQFCVLLYWVNPAELGIVTASQCFAESHLNREGKLSYEAFREWYSKPGPTQLVAQSQSNDVSGNNRGVVNGKVDGAATGMQPSEELDLDTLRKVTGLSALSASDLFSVFSASSTTNAAKKEVLTRAEFKRCFYVILKKQNRKPTREIARFLDRLFNAFDVDEDDAVDFMELSSGLSVLCGGSGEEKVAAAFSLFDADGDGYITQQEMETYLVSVFNVMYETTANARESIAIDAKTLAHYTTLQAFADSDMNHDGKLSLEEFRSWYWIHGQSDQRAVLPASAPTQYQPAVDHGHALRSIDFVASVTTLRDRTPSDVFEIIAAKVNEDGVLSREAFFSIFDELVRERAAVTKHKLTKQESVQLKQILETVFNGFDMDHDGFVDFCELSSGISVLCSGSQHEKIKAAFTLFDINQDGFISREEMETYLASVYRIIFTTSPAMVQQLHYVSPEQLAQITTADAFALADVNQDGRLSFEEFTKWYSTQNMPQSAAQAQLQPSQRPTAPSSGASSPRVTSSSSKGALNEMKELTNLSAYDVNDIFEFFRASADKEGSLTHAVFFRCFNKLLAKNGRISRDVQMKTQQLLKELFELFDTDRNGLVDVQELGAGLSILCGGSRGDKAKSMFTLYDVNQDGYISPEEMVSYLTSIFRVMFKASPDLPVKTGMAPEQLAKVTTAECFHAFDHNRDGQLSFEEFRRWFDRQNPRTQHQQTTNGHGESSSSVAGAASLESSEAVASGAIPVEVAKKLSGLKDMPLEKVSELFASAVNGGDQISRRAFDECFYKYISGNSASKTSAEESTRVHEVIDRLFTAFDTDLNGVVDFNELMSGLSILCGGSSRDEKVQAAFNMYDANGDGVISEDEMTHYLCSVFKLLYALDPSRQQQLGISANALAAATANEIFAVADDNHDGKLTFDEFQKWYSQPEQASFNDIVAPLDLNEVRQLTNLGNLDVVEVFERFAEHADEEGMLDRTSFDSCFFEIIEIAANPRTQIEKLRAKVVADRLFDVFDRDGNGRIDFSELASGLSVLCKGARDAKVKAAFRLYDFNADGFISLDEMKRYLTSIFKVLYEVQPEMRQETGVTAEELGVVTAEQAFLEADSNRDGKLSYDEFLTWYNSPAQAGISSAVAKNAVVDSSLHWMPLNEIKQLTNLAQYEPEEVFEIFAGEADQEGLLSRASFNESFRKVIEGQKMKTNSASAANPATQEKLQEVIDGLFDLFDTDSSGTVDFGELASGLSVLCGGTKDQKVEAAFSLFDFNGDGFISLDEMTRYLTSVFRVLFQVSPDTQSLGVSPEELGEVTAQQAFAEADQDHDGQLTLKEFQHWYQQPGGIGEVAKNGEQLFSLAEARRLTNLEAFSPMEVFEALADCADEQGYVSREAFDGCFRKIISANQGIKSEEYQRINAILKRLFELFDVDKNGLVDFSEISSGLSVFCGGSSEEKIRAAFALYDYNADGYISMEEMTRYLTSVFKVLKEASPGALQQMEHESPEELGVRTAQQAFEEADLDHDGRLSFPEFRKWYTRSSAANIERLIQNNIPEWLSLREVRRLTNLGSFSAEQVLNTFAKFTSADGTMDKDTFQQAFGHFKVESSSAKAGDRLQLLVDRLFDLFDKDKNGLVDFNELASGLSVLCGGSQTDKVRAAFNLYDVNHDGYISLGEMRLYLTSVFKVLFE
ncbi:hypothetical protein BBJ28_00016818, partial [Nothophytophthora sp. Chile5]